MTPCIFVIETLLRAEVLERECWDVHEVIGK